jgi:hypothetical protein
MPSKEGIQRAGDVVIEELKLISTDNIVFDLTEFLVEVNIFEDMFSTFLQGNIVVSDSLNLIEKAKIVGEELLILRIKTPSFDSKIQKTFRIFKISDRNIIRDNNTQTFVMHFASIELFYDILLPLFLPFEGTVHEVAGRIYEDFINTNRTFQIDQAATKVKEIEQVTPLVVLNPTENKVKFVSPGWSPFKCISWLASKAIPKEGTAKNYLFFESTKAFYFGSVDYIFKESKENDLSIGTYSIAASNIRDGANTPNISREYFIAKDIEMIDTTDHVKNYTNGYLANRLITLDVYNKVYEVVDYDYVNEYEKQFHSSGEGKRSIPIFTKDTLRNAATDISFYPVNEKLFDNFKNNVNERIKDIYGNRKSSLLDLTNLRMVITVPGRTDVQVGRILYFTYPTLGAASEKDKTQRKEDLLYSGYYLITAIRHKINKNEHTMVMELVKDSLTLEE